MYLIFPLFLTLEQAHYANILLTEFFVVDLTYRTTALVEELFRCWVLAISKFGHVDKCKYRW